MIGAVENAIIGALAEAGQSGVLGYAYATLDSYPEDFDAYLKDKGQLRVPAAWAVFLSLGQGVDNQDDVSGWTATASFVLVVAAQNYRNETATRQGGPDAVSEPGSYQLALDAVRILSRNWLVPLELVSPLRIGGMRLVSLTGETRRQGISLMAIELSCGIAFGQFADPGNPGDFATFHADWDVPPLGNVDLDPSGQLPSPNPDAEDLIQLPQ